MLRTSFLDYEESECHRVVAIILKANPFLHGTIFNSKENGQFHAIHSPSSTSLFQASEKPVHNIN
jgi:hypothetical protein